MKQTKCQVQIANHQQLEQAAVEQASKLLEVAVPHGGFLTSVLGPDREAVLESLGQMW